MATAFDRVADVIYFNTAVGGNIYTVPAGKYAFMYIRKIGAGSSIFGYVPADIEGPSTQPRRLGSIEVPLYAGDVVSRSATLAGSFVTGIILVFNLP
jgi:hypothetical protein